MSIALTTTTRRNLPHWRRNGAIYFVTFRLADSLPQAKVKQLREERSAWDEDHPTPWSLEEHREHEARFGERVQQWLDAGYGCCALARPDIRDAVWSRVVRFDGERMHLHGAVVMPNHVHALIQPLRGPGVGAGDLETDSQTRMSVSRGACILAGGDEFDVQAGASVVLSRLLKGIKGASARAANRLLDQTGAFWMDESYDRIVRDLEEYRALVQYIRDNPAKAGLSNDQYWIHVPAA